MRVPLPRPSLLLLLAACAPVTVTLSSLPVSPSRVDFGVVFVGDTREQAVSVTNIGDSELEVAIDLGGAAASVAIDHATATLSPGETSIHVVRLEPTTLGLLSTDLQVAPGPVDRQQHQ